MFLYQKIDQEGPDTLFSVGFYGPGGAWTTESVQESQEEAEKRTHYLNGGNDTKRIMEASTRLDFVVDAYGEDIPGAALTQLKEAADFLHEAE